ncbi:hypothetical protein [Paenibacillus sp. 453mf]|uniref:hypothetical protein n=1 Tax=Paenibacillus sp. 453mf TaxID=1761874 RepID=UPI0008EAFE16|nr:hypothetical protein [Paenibacillus sp. 453mf]SFS76119.1 hypothetical protein SAMN04488601_10338 [Paenibacillus sp. 453mf]
MSENDEKKSLIDVSLIPPEVTKDAYNDLIQPSAKNIGSVLGSLTGVLDTITLKIKYWNHKQRLIF